MWGLALLRTDSTLPWIFSLKSQKRLNRHLCASSKWPSREKFTLPDPGLSVREEFHPVLMAQERGVSSRKVYGFHAVPFYYTVTLYYGGRADGQPLLTPHQDAMVKWQQPDTKMKQINSGVSHGEDQTMAQHDNDHKATEALRLSSERHLFKWI